MLFDISGPVWNLSNVFQTPEPFVYIVLNEILQLICSSVFVRCIPKKKKEKETSFLKENEPKRGLGIKWLSIYQPLLCCQFFLSLFSWDKPVKECIGWNVFTARSTQRMD